MTSLRENIKKSLDDNLKKRDNIATATLRLILAAVNIFGGFLVTQRMLAMYKKKKKDK